WARSKNKFAVHLIPLCAGTGNLKVELPLRRGQSRLSKLFDVGEAGFPQCTVAPKWIRVDQRPATVNFARRPGIDSDASSLPGKAAATGISAIAARQSAAT